MHAYVLPPSQVILSPTLLYNALNARRSLLRERVLWCKYGASTKKSSHLQLLEAAVQYAPVHFFLRDVTQLLL